MTTDAPPQIVVRNVDPKLWRLARSAAVKHGMSAGAMLNEILHHWLETHDCDDGDCESFTTPPSRP